MSGGTGSGGAGRKGADEAERVGRSVQRSTWFQVMVTVGLISYGVVHLLVAFIIGQLAWTGRSEEASQSGAFQEMASTGFGVVMLWVTAAGLLTLTVWQAGEALWGHQDRKAGRERTVKRISSAGKAVIYTVLAVSAVTTATGGASSSGDDTEKTLTAQLMSAPFGRILVGAVGLGIVIAGGRLVYRGFKKKFVRDLAGSVSQGVVRLGQFGYAAKGVALAGVGALFVAAAVSYDPNKAGGLDNALRTLRGAPYGPVVLTVIALGIGAFGLYCFAWSRHAKKL